MLEKLLNKKVIIYIASYAQAITDKMKDRYKSEGIVTAIDENFIEVDNNEIIAIKYISKIKII